jgi:hypothetical protein
MESRALSPTIDLGVGILVYPPSTSHISFNCPFPPLGWVGWGIGFITGLFIDSITVGYQTFPLPGIYRVNYLRELLNSSLPISALFRVFVSLHPQEAISQL